MDKVSKLSKILAKVKWVSSKSLTSRLKVLLAASSWGQNKASLNLLMSFSQISRENLELQKLNGSQASMAMDLHLPNKGAITLKIKDRSDTARRHQLVRQTKLEDAEDLEDAKRTAALNRSYSPKPSGAYA